MRIRTRPKSTAEVSGITVRTISTKRADTSKQIEDDVFTSFGMADIVLPTPYSLPALYRVLTESNALPACIEAMVTNVVLFGYGVEPLDENTPENPAERKILESFIKTANTDESLAMVQEKRLYDYERFGFAFLEIIRDDKGTPTLLRHAPAYTTRVMAKAGDPVPIQRDIVRGGKRSRITEYRRFRRFVQISGGTRVYFKEFGDTRAMNSETGEYATKDKPVPVGKQATEILHERQYTEDPYGAPRWVSQMPSIRGSRESEECNVRYFQDNTISPVMMLVSGGRLTKTSFNDLQKAVTGKGQGKDVQHRMTLVEAIPEQVGLDDKSSVTMEVVKLADARQSDGLFSTYDKDNRNKVRGSFRFGPAVIGDSQDTNFANANVSDAQAEKHVFLPQRSKHDDWFNISFVNHPAGLKLKTVKLVSLGPRVANPDAVVKIMTALNVMGGLTPRTAIDVINQTVQLSIPQYPAKGQGGYEDWMDMPMSVAQRVYASRTQQTGEGKSQNEQNQKTPEIKDTEATGDVGPTTPEHGQE